MTELLTSAQMRAIEQAAIASGGVTGLELMERAGRGVVEAVFEEWPELTAAPQRAVVLCGPGNNGGDGFVVARLLHEWGWEVEVFLHGDPATLPPDAGVNHRRWAALGPVRPFPAAWPDAPPPAVIVDAGFGTGLSRPLADDLIAGFLGALPEGGGKPPHAPPFVVAVDVPTGLSSDSGNPMPAAVVADLTVTFHRARHGHFLARGPEFCGRVAVRDIGLDPRRWPDGIVRLTTAPDDYPAKRARDHKYAHGHALILSGGPGRGGAARLAARGALRIGAGLVTLGCPPAAMAENAAQLNAIMLRELRGGAGLAGALEDARINALCLGPGLGQGDESRSLVEAGLKSRRAAVLDADALTLIGRDASLFASLHAGCVLTPHGGEFARLFPDIAARLAEPALKGPACSKVDATREAAARAGCVVLYKGPDTVIAAPDGRCSINAAHYQRAAPWLATAGSGDVLSGFVAGLLARGLAPMPAAEAAAWLHVEAARSFGPGLIAEDLPEQLPAVLRRLGI